VQPATVYIGICRLIKENEDFEIVPIGIKAEYKLNVLIE
jgi:hypothetical protein